MVGGAQMKYRVSNMKIESWEVLLPIGGRGENSPDQVVLHRIVLKYAEIKCRGVSSVIMKNLMKAPLQMRH
jgi:hypothetical protein